MLRLNRLENAAYVDDPARNRASNAFILEDVVFIPMQASVVGIDGVRQHNAVKLNTCVFPVALISGAPVCPLRNLDKVGRNANDE